MSFCSSCGSVINQGNKFCSKCGTPIGVQSASSNSTLGQQEQTRKESLNELNRMIQFFGQKQQQYDEYDACGERITYLSDPKTQVRIRASGGKPLKIIGIILMAGCLPLALIISSIFTVYLESMFSSSNEAGAAWTILFVLILFLALAGGLTLLIIGILKNSNYASEQRKQKAIQLQQTKERLATLADELTAHYRSYGYCAVSPEYTNPKILETIKEKVWSGRADTIKEAINIMLQDEHYSEMELQAALTAKSAASAARGAKAAAFFSAANFVHSIRR